MSQAGTKVSSYPQVDWQFIISLLVCFYSIQPCQHWTLQTMFKREWSHNAQWFIVSTMQSNSNPVLCWITRLGSTEEERTHLFLASRRYNHDGLCDPTSKHPEFRSWSGRQSPIKQISLTFSDFLINNALLYNFLANLLAHNKKMTE